MIAYLRIYHVLLWREKFDVRVRKHESAKNKTHPVKRVFFSQVVVEVLENLPGFAVVAYLEELYTQLRDTMSGGASVVMVMEGTWS